MQAHRGCQLTQWSQRFGPDHPTAPLKHQTAQRARSWSQWSLLWASSRPNTTTQMLIEPGSLSFGNRPRPRASPCTCTLPSARRASIPSQACDESKLHLYPLTSSAPEVHSGLAACALTAGARARARARARRRLAAFKLRTNMLIHWYQPLSPGYATSIHQVEIYQPSSSKSSSTFFRTLKEMLRCYYCSTNRYPWLPAYTGSRC